MTTRSFKLWFGYPGHSAESGLTGPDEGCVDVCITLATGEVYELSIWTDAYLAQVRANDRGSGNHLNGQYLPLPDLLVTTPDLAQIEAMIADLIGANGLRPEWQIPDELTAWWDSDEPHPEDQEDGDEWISINSEEIGWNSCHGRPV